MNRTLKKITVHSVLWAMYFILNYTFARNYNIEFNLPFHIKTWCIQVILFYVNFLILIPIFLLKNKPYIFLVFSIITLSSFYFLKVVVDEEHFSRQRRREFFLNPPPEFRKNNDSSLNFSGSMSPLMIKGRIRPGKMHFNFMPFTSILMIYLAGISIQLTLKWFEDEKKKNLLEKEKISSELNFLKQQINPHFLFNSLNTIYSLSMTHSEKTTDSILKLSLLLRYILYEGEKSNVSLEDEINSLNNYIELQRLRITEKVKIEFNVSGNYKPLRIEPLLILPIVENAFKHGVDNAHESFIYVTIFCYGKKIEVKVENKIVKHKKLSLNEEGGIGLKNIQRRLELIYPDKHSIAIHNKEGLFTVLLTINL